MNLINWFGFSSERRIWEQCCGAPGVEVYFATVFWKYSVTVQQTVPCDPVSFLNHWLQKESKIC